MKIDLHLHSHFSDGALSPRVLAEECRKAGLEMIALTDHDSIGGIAEFLRAGKKLGIKTIPGLETSAEHEGREYHILGYRVDWKQRKLRSTLALWQIGKAKQIEEMVARLRLLGFSIDFSEVKGRATGSIDRVHITRTVFGNGKNDDILGHYNIKTQGDFFKTFLKESGTQSVFVPRATSSVEEAIRTIKKANGLVVWAHPFWKSDDAGTIRNKAEMLKAMGLDGLEVCYTMHNEEKTRQLHEIAQDMSLIETAGSDFHSFSMYMLNEIADFNTFGLDISMAPFLDA